MIAALAGVGVLAVAALLMSSSESEGDSLEEEIAELGPIQKENG
jgi:hypothetical protein